MAKRLVTFYSKNKADEIAESLNMKYMTDIIMVSGQEKTVYLFLENDKIHNLLQDKSKYSKRDYYCTSTLRF